MGEPDSDTYTAEFDKDSHSYVIYLHEFGVKSEVSRYSVEEFGDFAKTIATKEARALTYARNGW